MFELLISFVHFAVSLVAGGTMVQEDLAVKVTEAEPVVLIQEQEQVQQKVLPQAKEKSEPAFHASADIILEDLEPELPSPELADKRSVEVAGEWDIVLMPLDEEAALPTPTKKPVKRVVDLRKKDPYYAEEIDADYHRLSEEEKKQGVENFVALLDELGMGGEFN